MGTNAEMLTIVRQMRSIVEKAERDGADFTDPDVIRWLRNRDDFRTAASRYHTLRYGISPTSGDMSWLDKEPKIDVPTSPGWQSARQQKKKPKA